MVKIPFDIKYLEALYQQGHRFANDDECCRWLDQYFQACIVVPPNRCYGYIEFNEDSKATEFMLKYG